MLHLILLASLLYPGISQSVAAQTTPLTDHGLAWGKSCSTANQRYDQNTYALITDCDAQTYCAANGTCAYRGCRKDVFPYGYNYVPFDELPPLCPQGSFCPDESDRCLPSIPVGGQCQKDRDDQCAPAPNYRDFANYLNVNGSICLDYTCRYANVLVGQTCINDNTRYTAYTDAGQEYAIIVSRDNCATNLYCDGTVHLCLRMKSVGSACSGNKECNSYNCVSGTCGLPADEPIHPPVYSYVLTGIGIISLIVGVLTTLWFFHRRTRNENQRKLEQYYNEQMAFRHSIMSMHQAKAALLGQNNDDTPSRPQSLYTPSNHNAGGDTASLAPPGPIRRDSEAGWSEEGSEVLLVPPGEGERDRPKDVGAAGELGQRWR